MIYGLQEKHKEWDELLPYAFSAYNATIHETTKFTPNFLWHGRELRNTVGNLVPETIEEEQQNYGTYAAKTKKLIQIAYDVAREHYIKVHYNQNVIMIRKRTISYIVQVIRFYSEIILSTKKGRKSTSQHIQDRSG